MKIFFMHLLILSSIFLCLYTIGDAEGNADYAGTEVCKGCHQEYYDSYIRSVHAKKEVSGSPANHYGCESCHGAGSEHAGTGAATGIFTFGKKNMATDRSARCLACHDESPGIVFWDSGKHRSSDISCDNCHSIHRGTNTVLKSEDPEVCFNCHRDIKLQSNKQSHHPVREGRMKCRDCHNPHGGFGAKMINADSVNELCFKCHAEKRGPFRFEHSPVAESCLNCHEVHGSNHRSLLVRKTPQLCQSCHESIGHPGQPYTSFEGFRGGSPDSRMISRACLNCHTNVHGSNGPSGQGLKFFR